MHGYYLPTLPRYAKLIISLFLIVMGLTYLVGLVNIWNKTKFTYQGAVENERGSEEKMIYPKEFGDLLSLTHVHMGGWAMMFMWVLLFFMFSTYSARLKAGIGWMPFFFAPLDAASMWLTRYVSPGFAWLFMIAGFGLAALYALIIILDLANLWWGKGPAPAKA